MHKPLVTVFFALLCSANSFAQWEDIRKLGSGGETYVSTDGKGTIYASSHLPTQVYVSKDYGATFGKPHEFPDALGDMVAFARPGGKALVTYMYSFSKAGMASAITDDFGATWKQGEGIPGRPLDREWVTVDEKTGTAYMIYSDGYIGGPKSKGVFLSSSEDQGLTWKEVGRIDKEAEGDYPVDPHLVSSSDGKLYAFWTTSKDYNSIDTYKCAVSTNGGKTWGKFMTIANVAKKVAGRDVDVQERWMLGGLAAYGEQEVMAYYVNYTPVDVAGSEKACMAIHVRYSHDAGTTWTDPQTVLNKTELQRAAKLYYGARVAEENYPEYMQCLSWGCFDAKGRPHFIWQENRDGQTKLEDHYFNQWRVRHNWAPKPGAETVTSEPVSKPVVCNRPPLDFMCCTADDKFVYITWTETPKNKDGWAFSGEFWFGRKKID